jgi:hypothetical protein
MLIDEMECTQTMITIRPSFTIASRTVTSPTLSTSQCLLTYNPINEVLEDVIPDARNGRAFQHYSCK